MNALLPLLQYATSGPWVFVGSAILLSIATTGAARAAAVLIRVLRS